MAEIDPNIIIEISTRVAEIGERTKALQAADTQAQAAADHRHRNIMQAIENFVPRREIEAMNTATRAYAEQVAKDTRDHCDVNRDAVVARVDRIDDTLKGVRAAANKFIVWALGVLGAALVAGGGYLISHLMHLQIGWQN